MTRLILTVVSIAVLAGFRGNRRDDRSRQFRGSNRGSNNARLIKSIIEKLAGMCWLRISRAMGMQAHMAARRRSRFVGWRRNIILAVKG